MNFYQTQSEFSNNIDFTDGSMFDFPYHYITYLGHVGLSHNAHEDVFSFNFENKTIKNEPILSIKNE